MKKKILFVIPSLEIGGAEKSLINLLSAFDYESFDVDLLLLSKQNEMLNQLPNEVKVIIPNQDYFWFTQNLPKAIFSFIISGKFKLAFYRFLYSAVLKYYSKNKNRGEQYSWKYLRQSIALKNNYYDSAIGYLEKTSTYLVVDCINAVRKLGFIRANYDSLKLDKNFDSAYFKKLFALCSNGQNSFEILCRNFPSNKIRKELVYNVTDPGKILALAKEPYKMSDNFLKIVSVGRLDKVKGYEMSIEAAKNLKKSNVRFKWYVLGEGSNRRNLEQKINYLGLEEDFILLGAIANPFPYIKNCDIFVQSSIYEGRSNTVMEAKILCKPIVVTNFESVNELITNNVNGIICSKDAQSISQAIQFVIENPQHINKLITNLVKEREDSKSAIQKLYEII